MPENGAVGSVRISTKLDNSGLSRDITKAGKEINRLTEQFNRSVLAVRRNEAAVAKLRRELEAIKSGEKNPASLTAMESQLKRITAETKALENENSGLLAQYNAAVQRVEEMRGAGFTPDQMTDAVAEVDRLSASLNPVWDQLNALEEKAGQLRDRIAEIKLDPSTSNEARNLADKIGLAEDKLTLSTDKANGLQQALRAALNTHGNPAEKSVKRLGGNADKAAKNVRRLGKETRTAGRESRKAESGFARLGKRLLRLAAAALVFNVIRRGLSELAQFLGNVLKANTQFTSSLNNIQVNLLTAFAPIWEHIQPSLLTFMSVLERVTAAVAKFIALLFGKTFSQAKSSAEAMYDQAKSIEEVGSAADKASKSLAGFDELNNLSSNDAGGGGNTDAGLDFSTPTDIDWMAESLPWLDAFQEMLESIKRLVEAIADTWKEVWNSDVGKKFLQAINDLLITIFNTIRDIADAFRAAWEENDRGKRLIESFLKLLTEIVYIITDIIEAFRLAWNENDRGKNMLAAIMEALIKIMDFARVIGETFREAWNSGLGQSIFANILEIITNIANIAGNLAERLRIAWEENGNGERIWTAILGIIDSILGFINRITEATANWASTLDFGGIVGGFASLLEAIQPVVDIILDGLAWAYENILLPFGMWLIELAVPAALDILAGVFEVINSTLEALQPLAKWLWEEFLQPLGEWAGDVVIEALGFVADALKTIAEWISENQKLVETITIIIGSFVAAWLLVNGAITAWNAVGAIATTVTTAFGAAVAFLTSPIGLIVLAIGALIAIIVLLVKNWDWVKETAAKVWDGIKNIWDKVANWFKDKVVDPIKNAFKGAINFLIGLAEGFANGFVKAINWIIGAFNKISFDIPDWVPVIGGKKFGFDLKTLNEVSIPRLAQGTVVQPNAPFVAMLGDNRKEQEVVSPVSTIEDAVRNVMGEQGGGGETHLHVHLDGKEIYHTVVKKDKEHIKQTGKSAFAY